MRLIKCFMTQSTWLKANPSEIKVKGVLWHSTGANNPNLKRYVQPDDNVANKNELLNLIGLNKYGNDWNHIEREAGISFWIGKLADGSIATIQTGPDNIKQWGCGGSLNNTHIQFEICEDGLNDEKYFKAVYREAIELTAYICKKYGLNPLGSFTYNKKKVPVITDHQESHSLGMGSNHGDVKHWFKKYLGEDYLETIRKDVHAEMAEDLGNGTFKEGGCEEMGCPYWKNGKCTKDEEIKAGDLVEIIGSVYYNGKTIPSWVKSQKWFVHSLSGDRVVINKNEKGTNAIMSPVNKADLRKV